MTQIQEATASLEHVTRVHIRDERDDSLLSEAFHHPCLLIHELALAQDSIRSAVAPPVLRQTLIGQEILLVRRRIDKGTIAWLLSLLLVTSPAAGTVVGRFTHRADVGVAVSAGIFALASFLLGLAGWLQF